MPLNEADTRAKLIDPAIHTQGWTEDHIKREVSAGSIEIIEGKAHRKAKGRIDYTLRIKVTAESQPVAVALIEAKAERLQPGHGLEQAKAYATCKRINVPFVFFRQVVGLAMSDRLTADFAIRALYHAIGRRMPPPGSILHSDRWVQYAVQPLRTY